MRTKLRTIIHKIIDVIKATLVITDEELEEYFVGIEDDEYWIN